MGTVSTTLPSDGQTIDAADVNTPINAILSEFNGNIDNDNIKSTAAIAGSKIADASITNAKLSTTAGELGGAWVDWTPTWGGLTVGNGTLTYAKYTKIGKTVFFRLKFVYGSTSALSGEITFTSPTTMTTQGAGEAVFGSAIYADAATAIYQGILIYNSTTTIRLRLPNVASTYPIAVQIATTVPMTWAANDVISVSGAYEEA